MDKITQITVDELMNLLHKYGLPIHLYGEGKANTLKEMCRCINSGDFYLAVDNGVLKRYVTVIAMTVFSKGSSMVLVEKMQILKDGRTRERNLDTSIGEMVKAGEDPEAAALRALKEEFPVALMCGGSETLQKGEDFSREKESPTYPGLITKYVFKAFSVRLLVDIPLCQTLVYEDEPGFATVFDWEPVKK